jgi:hypothetical protein
MMNGLILRVSAVPQATARMSSRRFPSPRPDCTSFARLACTPIARHHAFGAKSEGIGKSSLRRRYAVANEAAGIHASRQYLAISKTATQAA